MVEGLSGVRFTLYSTLAHPFLHVLPKTEVSVEVGRGGGDRIQGSGSPNYAKA